MCLASVFEHLQVVALRDFENAVHIAGGTSDVDGENQSRIFVNVLFKLRGVDQGGFWVGIDEYRQGMVREHGVDGRHECVGRHEDFVAGPDVESREGGHQRGGATARRLAVGCADILGPGFFELRDAARLSSGVAIPAATVEHLA